MKGSDEMTDFNNLTAAALGMLKANVGLLRPPAEIEDFMISCIKTAAADLERASIVLDSENTDDLHLLSMYAAWLYRNRVAGAAKPEMLRGAMRNRQVSATSEADR